MYITDKEIDQAERLLLKQGCTFDEERRNFIKYMGSCDVLAVPGSGKTTAWNVGLFYMSIGYFFAKHECKYRVPMLLSLFLISVALRSVEIECLGTNTLQAVEAVLLFMIGVNVKFDRMEKYSLTVRKLSTAIYLEHFPFILLYDFYLKKGTVECFTVTLVFCFVAYFILQKVLPRKAMQTLFGC